MKKEIITKSAFARHLKISRSRISQYCTRGMPVSADGKLDRDAALAWVTANVHQPFGGWGVFRHSGAASTTETRADTQTAINACEPRPEENEAYRRVLHELYRSAGRIPEILAAGVRNLAVLMNAPPVFQSLLALLSGAFHDLAFPACSDFDDAEWSVRPDYGELAGRFGIEGDPAGIDPETICERVLEADEE